MRAWLYLISGLRLARSRAREIKLREIRRDEGNEGRERAGVVEENEIKASVETKIKSRI